MATRLLVSSRTLSRQLLVVGRTTTTITRRSFAAKSSDENLVKTALNNLHKELGGDMVPFAGYELPVLYKGSDNGGVMKEHLWCREQGKASLFDVSHMGQVRERNQKECNTKRHEHVQEDDNVSFVYTHTF
jgi:Aminomethyltransferase folate-binding domain